MNDFTPVDVTLTTVGGVLTVIDADVRLKSFDVFSLAGTPPDGDFETVPDPPQPFSMADSQQDPSDHKYQKSKLIFNQSAILSMTEKAPNNWHKLAFDPRCTLSQMMNIAGGGQKKLVIHLKCTEDPQPFANHVEFAVTQVGKKFVALGNTIILAAQKLFGRRTYVKGVLPAGRDIDARA